MVRTKDISEKLFGVPEGAREPLPESLSKYTGFLVAKAHQTLFQRFSQICREIGLEVPSPAILHLLAERGKMRQQDLGRLLRIDRTTMVKLVDGLEESGLVRRLDHPEDRRVYLIEITAAGKKVITALHKRGEVLERGLLEGFTEAERAVVRRALITLAG